MKNQKPALRLVAAVLLPFLLAGCSMTKLTGHIMPSEPANTESPGSFPQSHHGANGLVSAPPMPRESLGLYLETEARTGKMEAPCTVLCNVILHPLNNSAIPVWMFPKVTFYAEQDGEFYPLRVIEVHSGGIWAPHSMSGSSVTLPRPPRPGRWNIFAIQEHSEKVYRSHRRTNPEKIPLVCVEDQDESHRGMWTNSLVSNVMTIEFAEIGPAEKKEAEAVVVSLVKAGQYKTDFKEPRSDPTPRLSEHERGGSLSD
jgi:hypothetical protein